METHTHLVKEEKEELMALQDNQARCRSMLDALQQDINNCIKSVKNSLRNANLDDDEIQEELAKQISLLHSFGEYIARLQRDKRKTVADCVVLQSKLNSIELALSTLLFKHADEIIFAKQIRYSIEYFLNSKRFFGFTNTLFKRTVRELPTPTKVLLGLALVLPVYFIGVPISLFGVTVLSSIAQNLDVTEATPAPNPTSSANASTIAPTEKAEDTQPILSKHAYDNFEIIMMIALSGALGSMVSIFIRLQDYRGNDYKGSATPILVGFTKPFIGTAFGVFVFALINSNIISFPIIQGATSNFKKSSEVSEVSRAQEALDAKYYFFFAIAFLVGFSERLNRDIVDRAESAVGLKKTVRDDIHRTARATQKTADATQKIEAAIDPDASAASPIHPVEPDASAPPANEQIEPPL